MRVCVAGAGAFGVAAALELRRRGHDVTLVDPGPVPHPDASSTDVSKAVRMDYADEHYMALMEEAFAGWDAWNTRWTEPLYHEDGFVFLSSDAMAPGRFEAETFGLLRRRGHAPVRLDAAAIARRAPALAPGRFVDGYFNPRAGWAESGAVVGRLAAGAREAGVVVREGTSFARLHETDDRIEGIVTATGEVIPAECTIVAGGAWTPLLLPWLADRLWATAQPAFHFRPADGKAFEAPNLPVWAADLATDGWYGFPALPGGLVKVSNHGTGRRIRADAPRAVTGAEIARCREFLRGAFPALADAPLESTRLCLYCDTFDGDFWIDRDPGRPGLVVAAGGSGHGFKFAPVLGRVIADVVDGKDNRWAGRFAWRDAGPDGPGVARETPRK